MTCTTPAAQKSTRLTRICAFLMAVIGIIPSLGCDTHEAVFVEDSEQALAVSGVHHPLVISLTVHLEGWDMEWQHQYNRYLTGIEDHADRLEAFGAVATWEAADILDGIERHNIDPTDNILVDLVARGHAVGVHADMGTEEGLTQEEFEDGLSELRTRMADVGIDARHVSGISSPLDWATASRNAGFEFVNGQIAYALQSLDDDLIPEEHADCASPIDCHYAYPTELEEKLTPWRFEDGSNWVERDTDGDMVLMHTSGGTTCMAESLVEESPHGCPFNSDDIDALIDTIDEALMVRDPNLPSAFNIVWSYGQPLDDGLTDMLQAIEDNFGDEVQWMTRPEFYDQFLLWESTLLVDDHQRTEPVVFEPTSADAYRVGVLRSRRRISSVQQRREATFDRRERC